MKSNSYSHTVIRKALLSTRLTLFLKENQTVSGTLNVICSLNISFLISFNLFILNHKAVTEQLYFDKTSWSKSFTCFLPGRLPVFSFPTDFCFLKDRQFQKNMTLHVKVGYFLAIWEGVTPVCQLESGVEGNHVFLEKLENMHMQYSK